MATKRKYEIQNNIRSVEVCYNDNEKQFDEFLKSIIKNYIFNDTLEGVDNEN